jgi:SAM-dependent methyltransferase
MNLAQGGLAGASTLKATTCAICHTLANADELYPSTIQPSALTAQHFSARRLPDGAHHRIVRCRACGLVRSDPVLDPGAMAELYRNSTFDYGAELDGLRITYGAQLERLEHAVLTPGALLDIGCGNGFVLSLALQRRWRSVRGVEPSDDAIARAPANVRGLIVNDMIHEGLFEPASFDAITLFQVLDHMPDPGALLRECWRILRPGGVILAFNHNVEAHSARLLRERSPIIDVEHTYLFSPTTMTSLFQNAGFAVESVGPVRNTYSIGYLLHLLPAPPSLKRVVSQHLARTSLGNHHVTIGLGNLCLLARRVQ